MPFSFRRRPATAQLLERSSEAKALYDAGRYAEAAAEFADLVSTIRGLPERPEQLDDGLSSMLFHQADAEGKSGDINAAMYAFMRLAELHEQRKQPREAAYAWEAAARHALQVEAFREAEASARRALEAEPQETDRDQIDRAGIMAVLGRALWLSERNREAEEVLREALRILPARGEDASWVRYECSGILVDLASTRGDTTSAAQWAEEMSRVVDLIPDPHGQWHRLAKEARDSTGTGR
jgi:tetratricopeptide (TPR) repeat protein